MRRFFSDRWAPLRDGLFFYAQLAMIGGILIVVLISSGSHRADDLPHILWLGVITIGASVVATLPPWHRLSRHWLIVAAIADVAIVAALRYSLFASQPALSILVVIPTLWLAYSFGLVGVVVATVCDYVVSLIPYAQSGDWPRSAAAWGSATLIPAIVSGVGIVVYITARHIRKQSEQLTLAYDELTAAVNTRDEFLRTISHELRTPLTSMIGYLEVIEDGVDLSDAGIATPFGIIQRNSQRLLSLINSLITEAHGRPEPTRRPENVAELATRAIDAARPAAARAGIRIAPPLLETVEAELDAGDIGEVLDELLSNALKFTPRGGTISLSLASENDSVVIRVADTGIGIAANEQPHVFERFFRGAAARQSVIAGTGLGLSTVKTIVDAHAGTVTAVGIMPHGTAIEIRLPLAIPAPARMQRSRP